MARALEKRRRDVILVTKCGVKPPPPGQLGPLRDSSRDNILREVDASLKRLRTDWVDVLLVHWPDATRRSRRLCARSRRSWPPGAPASSACRTSPAP